MSSSTTIEKEKEKVNVLMIGTGEYTTGYVNGQESDSDKGAGVVALVMMDMKRRNKTNRLALCGVNGKKFPGIRQHMENAIGKKYRDLDDVKNIESFPADDVIDSKSYLTALQSFQPGDAVTIFTPDDTHFEIALACIEHGLHVLVTKPIVKTLQEHTRLDEAAKRKNVLCMVEVHKRYDPIYIDARDRIQNLGDFSYMYAYMSQPKHQLDTFRAWAGKSSDISYYLNSHHVDFCEWATEQRSRPIRVTATASMGVATRQFNIQTEDTITLTVLWENKSGSTGTGVYTSSWAAPKADVHSQQRFFYMGQKGEITVDQAHRGYNTSVDGDGYRSVNPLFMKYTPTNGKFSGQNGYGYVSFEKFIDAAREINAGEKTPSDFDESLPTVGTTYLTTSILEAGRMSLDLDQSIEIVYNDINKDEISFVPTALQPVEHSRKRAKVN